MASVSRIAALALAVAHAGCASTATTAPGVGAEDISALCQDSAPQAKPLTVGLAAEVRADLERRMSQGVAAVALSCDELVVLVDCQVDGRYDYAGVETKVTATQMRSRGELSANIPGGVAEFAAAVAGESTLDVALAIAGSRRTQQVDVRPSELRGACAGATHFVKGAVVGAFATSRGRKGRAAVAATIFGVGTAGQAEHSTSEERRDGDLSRCMGSSIRDEHPRPGCAATVRLELRPISESGPVPMERRCPDGFGWVRDRCAAVDRASLASCGAGSEASCDALCSAGEGPSCHRLGALLETSSLARALDAYRRGCSLGEAHACSRAGVMYRYGMGTEKNPKRAIESYRAACDALDADGCTNLGVALDVGLDVPPDPALARFLFRGACQAGDPHGCLSLAYMMTAGRGGVVDLPRARELLTQAIGLGVDLSGGCQAGYGYACVGLGLIQELGVGMASSSNQAAVLYRQGCKTHEWGCAAAQRLTAGSKGQR